MFLASHAQALLWDRAYTKARAYAQEYYDDVPGWEEEDDDEIEVQHVTTICRTLVRVE